jgi:hypothetical protein
MAKQLTESHLLFAVGDVARRAGGCYSPWGMLFAVGGCGCILHNVQTRQRSMQGNNLFDSTQSDLHLCWQFYLQIGVLLFSNLPAEQSSQLIWCIIPHSKILIHLAKCRLAASL